MLYYKFSQIKGNFQSLMGKWFARTITNGTLETADVARLIQNNCTVKYSDVIAVLKELQEVLTDKLQEGLLGSFGQHRLLPHLRLVEGCGLAGGVQPGHGHAHSSRDLHPGEHPREGQRRQVPQGGCADLRRDAARDAEEREHYRLADFLSESGGLPFGEALSLSIGFYRGL